MCRPFSFAACVRHHRSPKDLFRLRMKTRSRSTLVHLLLSKSMAEALLVTAVAVAFYFSTTNRHLRGVLDRSDSQTVTGWVVDEAQPATRVEVQLFIDEKCNYSSMKSSRRAAWRLSFALTSIRHAAPTMTGMALSFRHLRSQPASTKRGYMRCTRAGQGLGALCS